MTPVGYFSRRVREGLARAMKGDLRERVTALVTALGDDGVGVEAAATSEELMLLVYPNLKRLAGKYLASERRGHTLQPTALVHEAYCRLVDQDSADFNGRTHFFAVSARVMRRVLIDYARARKRDKRGGERQRVTLVTEQRSEESVGLDMDELLNLNSALDRLAELDPRQAEILELRFFAGLTVKEVANALGLSKRTVEGDWTHARVWLRRELERGAQAG